MLGIHDYSVFVGSAILLNITPGPDTFYILGRSLTEGRKGGLVSVFGVSCGLLVHTIAVSLGLSAILLTSASLFALIKYLGAGYLIFLGIKLIFFSGGLQKISKASQTNSFWKIYRQGFLTNALNPKVALFFLALLPQFVDADSSNPRLSFFVLGMTFIVTATVWCVLLALCASKFSLMLRASPRVSRTLDALTGILFFSLGIKLALSKQSE